MFRRRLYFFIFVCVIAVTICFCRLAYMQTTQRDLVREVIRESQIDEPKQLPTVRGTIYDRCKRPLAIDKPKFYVKIGYQLTKYIDQDFHRASILKNMKKDKSYDQSKIEINDKFKKKTEDIYNAIDKCNSLLGVDRELLLEKIGKINRSIWKLREVVAWKKSFPKSELYLEYKAMEKEVPYFDAMKDFEAQLALRDLESPPSHRKANAWAKRYKLALDEDLLEMRQLHPIYKINDEDEESHELLLKIQEEFAGIEGLEIAPITERVYQYGSTACHLIGWVGPAQIDENALFPKDVYSIYNADDFSGKRGIEKACEVVLRGKRGEVTYSKDDELLSLKPRQFGEDLYLSIDIELQHRIEHYLSDKTIFPDPNAEIGAVVIDVGTGEILAMVSIPTYDLREIRRKDVYDAVSSAKTQPFKNKTLWETYPPGSVIKPFFLAMGLEEGKVTAGEIIHCAGTKPPTGWPDCIIHRVYHGSHDNRWAGEGGNNGVNAIRGSCNIYFSILADRMPSEQIQSWLYNFGFGHRTLMPANYPGLLKELKRTESEAAERRLLEADGIIYTGFPTEDRITSIEDLPKLASHEKRRFGIGQASMRVTVLQVANGMAALARNGLYKYPRLYTGDTENKKYRPIDLGISSSTIRVVREGMHAVVYKSSGTANSAYTNRKFKYNEKFPKRNIKVFGKTGSTQRPYNAWFAGFAEDNSDRSLAFAIVVERGESGSQHAAPKGLRILEICNEMGYIGDQPEGQASR